MDIDISTVSAAVTLAKNAVDTLKSAFSAKEKIGVEREVSEAFEQLGKVHDKLIELRRFQKLLVGPSARCQQRCRVEARLLDNDEA